MSWSATRVSALRSLKALGRRQVIGSNNSNVALRSLSSTVGLFSSMHRHQNAPTKQQISTSVTKRCFSSEEDPLSEPREAMAFDVLIVGGGPAGLAAAIRIKQLCQETGKELSVCVIDKGSEIGAHILSGNVFDPKALHELFPDMADKNSDNHWTKVFENEQGSSATPVQHDQFLVLTEDKSMGIPHFLLPSQLHNDGNYIISLSQLCRWLGKKAEELEVEVYPGFAASEVVLDEATGAVKGIATRDVGIGKDGQPKATFERGSELHARQTLFAEGARGSCSEFLIEHFDLREDGHPQTYGLGIKEVWEIPEENFQPGLVQHTLGYPLQSSVTDKVFGGTFLYHQEPNLVLAGLVVGLDYQNPYLNPYQEFQRWKTHPDIKKHFEGGTCVSYGARVLNEGGYHSIPKLTFPGGALLGCSAGFLNAVKIKGSHTALKSGMLAADATFEALTEEEGVDPVADSFEYPEDYKPQELTAYESKVKDSWINDELYEVRNSHESFARWGVGGGLVYTGIATHVTKGREPWTLSHTERDSEKTKQSTDFKPIDYPPPDGKLTFDLLTNLQRSGTYHEDDQPSHLRIKPELGDVPKNVSLQVYAGPEQRFCPAGVYEYVDNDEESGPDKKLVINAQVSFAVHFFRQKSPRL
ncbi:flavoprotein-ubiquinone oxidoreductase, mitochondrial [Seminavis robusta]|uniref:Electron transfer flavoprotein-ubiquinone oxidoreductase n=1 Tax=Seminavis robusta TaxID=568900 RepID=A0A9N8DX14_9STRA|nr:flavoprotein-ubiquinone oxidoreductase, mitochondrial [Seminavis robusta]|eukprot:Sro440_g143470.1 flavoprotein-ubiquinone oxidoreductase, mitochondrial (643) ;mRNA; r:33403-35476